MQGDIQSSGIFCFGTTKRISSFFACISGAALDDCVCGWFCVCKNAFFGWGLSSRVFIVISTALESEVSFNYFFVNIRKLVFKTDFAFWKPATLQQVQTKCINSLTYSTEQWDNKCSSCSNVLLDNIVVNKHKHAEKVLVALSGERSTPTLKCLQQDLFALKPVLNW